MSTFYGGEQLVQVVQVSGTNTDLDIGEYPVIYTIPSGHYGILKFAHIGFNNSGYLWTNVSATIELAPSDANLADNNDRVFASVRLCNGLVDYAETKLGYRPNTVRDSSNYNVNDGVGLYNLYLEEGDKLYLAAQTNNQNCKYEAKIHLYKKP